MVFATCQFVDALPLYDVKPSAWYTDVNKNYGRSSRPKGVYMFQPLNLVWVIPEHVSLVRVP